MNSNSRFGTSPFKTLLAVTSALFVCVATTTLAPVAHAQTLKQADQAKVDKLIQRLNKSVGEEKKAQTALDEFKTFSVFGKVQSGDNTYASIYGKAISGRSGPGSITDDNFLYIKNPVESEYSGGNYRGECTFLGVVNGRNTYLPVAVQPDYVTANNNLYKWKEISTSIRAEINVIYLPYEKQIKNQEAAKQAQVTAKAKQQQQLAAREREKAEAQATAKAKQQQQLEAKERDKAEAQAQAEQAKQDRIDQAREQLAQAQREVEQAKINQAAKKDADAEVARLQAETEKLNAEKARIETETQKQAQEAANTKAQQLQEVEAQNQATIEKLKNTVSLIPGKQLGKIRLGMTEAEVLREIGAPDSALQLNKIRPRAMNGVSSSLSLFTPRKIRRDRYSLNAVDGLNISYEGSPIELNYFAWERGIDAIEPGDSKKDFVFDIFYIDGKVVQLESDSPQFFDKDRRNLLSTWEFNNPFETEFIMDYHAIGNDNGVIREASDRDRMGYGGLDASGTAFGKVYIIEKEQGFSLLVDAISTRSGKVTPVPQLIPRSRMKLVIYSPNTTPYTGDYQLGLSLFNHKTGSSSSKNITNSDADNVEERMYSLPMNENPVSKAANQAVKSGKESLGKKLKRKLGDFLP